MFLRLVIFLRYLYFENILDFFINEMQCGLLAIRFRLSKLSYESLPMYFRFGYYYESFIHEKINDFVLHVATVNGSGSMSANNILVKALSFGWEFHVSGKIYFLKYSRASTWFTIRAN